MRPENTHGPEATDLGQSNRGGVIRALAELPSHIGMRSTSDACALGPQVRIPESSLPSQMAYLSVCRALAGPATTSNGALVCEHRIRLGALDRERFRDAAPATMFATLCSYIFGRNP